jgi:hypothetical protein
MPKKKKQELELSDYKEQELKEKIESNQEVITKSFHISILALASFMLLIFIYLLNSKTKNLITSESKLIKNEIDNVHTVQLNILEKVDSLSQKIDDEKIASQKLSNGLEVLDEKLEKNYNKVNYVSETLDTLVVFVKK